MSADPDGVRIVREPGLRPFALASIVLVFIALAVAATLTMQKRRSSPIPPAESGVVQIATPAASNEITVDAAIAAQPAPQPIVAPQQAAEPAAEWRTGDANDIASYFSPGDPVPTGGELIRALRATGETEGIAAFNPPGTVPLMIGIAVPPEFPLPPGYVRHHQVTDEGEPIEPILMYAPDAVLRDAAGNLIPIPEDRIVPAHLAPPGLPIRQIALPPVG